MRAYQCHGGAQSLRGGVGVLHVAAHNALLVLVLERGVVLAQQTALARPVKQHPQLAQTVDDRRASQQQAVRGRQAAARLCDQIGRILDRVTLVQHAVVPRHAAQLVDARFDHAIRRKAHAAVLFGDALERFAALRFGACRACCEKRGNKRRGLP